MLEAMQASRLCAPAFSAKLSTSRCTSGEIVAQLMKSLPLRLDKEVVVRRGKDLAHRRVVGNDRDDDIRRGGDFA